MKDLGWSCLELHPSEKQSVLVDREVVQLNLELLPANSQEKADKERKKNVGIIKSHQFAKFEQNRSNSMGSKHKILDVKFSQKLEILVGMVGVLLML